MDFLWLLQEEMLLLERQTQEVAVEVAGLLQSHLARLVALESSSFVTLQPNQHQLQQLVHHK